MVRDDLVEARPSPIHGTGLFATAFIPAGTRIGDLEGMPVTTELDHSHTIWMAGPIGVQVKGLLRFINHSRRPNAAYFGDLSVEAIRDIPAGAEITHDYGEEQTT